MISKVWDWLVEDYKRVLYIGIGVLMTLILCLVISYVYNIDDKDSYKHGTFMTEDCQIGSDSKFGITINGKYEEKFSILDMMFNSVTSMTKYGDYIDLAQDYADLCESIKVEDISFDIPKEAGYVSIDTNDLTFTQSNYNNFSYELYQWGTTYKKKYSDKECTEMNFILISSKKDVLWGQIKSESDVSWSVTAYKGYINVSN